jgi:hypothetical protein
MIFRGGGARGEKAEETWQITYDLEGEEKQGSLNIGRWRM